jgi:hypothetical protein
MYSISALQSPEVPTILRLMQVRTVTFDETHEQIAIATHRGFIMYDSATGCLLYEAKFGGTSCLALPSDSNLVAVSGDVTAIGFPPIAIVLWDCRLNRASRAWTLDCPIDFLFFLKDCLVAVAGDKILFYDCCTFSLTYTTTNPVPGRVCIDLQSSASLHLAAFPSPDGDCLLIADYRDPAESLGSIPVRANQIRLVKFDRTGELLALVLDEAKQIQLWSVLALRMLGTFKQGRRAAEISGIAFDSLSTFFVATTKRGTLHAFAIPPAAEWPADGHKAMRAKFSFELSKRTDFCCEFDVAGYTLNGISTDGKFRQLRLDIEKGAIIPVTEKELEG